MSLVFRETMPIPPQAKIYHITHINNLRSIIDAVLWSDAERLRQRLNCEVVGMSEIKRRRIEDIEVDCHAGTMVGDYVPFYFCPRSVMLYILHKGNSPGLTYQGGQSPIIHLQSDLRQVLAWLANDDRKWAYTKGNAGAFYTAFYNTQNELNSLEWTKIAKDDWRNPDVKEAKQSEFLVEGSFPWELVELIGVLNNNMAQQVASIVAGANHRPPVVLRPNWYY